MIKEKGGAPLALPGTGLTHKEKRIHHKTGERGENIYICLSPERIKRR